MDQQNNRSNNMALASMIIGIASIVLSCCCCGGVVCGALAIIFACLSRVEETFSSRAKVGLITGIIGIVMGAFVGLIMLIMTEF